MRLLLLVAALGASLAASAQAQTVSVVPQGGMVADLVRVPAGAEMAYVAGTIADPSAPAASGTAARFGDTRAQTISILGKIEALLQAQGFSMDDVVMMRVALVGDPAKGGAMDFAGMNAGYAQFFRTTRHKPARMTTQVAALTEAGALVEIEVQAAKAPAAR